MPRASACAWSGCRISVRQGTNPCSTPPDAHAPRAEPAQNSTNRDSVKNGAAGELSSPAGWCLVPSGDGQRAHSRADRRVRTARAGILLGWERLLLDGSAGRADVCALAAVGALLRVDLVELSSLADSATWAARLAGAAADAILGDLVGHPNRYSFVVSSLNNPRDTHIPAAYGSAVRLQTAIVEVEEMPVAQCAVRGPVLLLIRGARHIIARLASQVNEFCRNSASKEIKGAAESAGTRPTAGFPPLSCRGPWRRRSADTPRRCCRSLCQAPPRPRRFSAGRRRRRGSP